MQNPLAYITGELLEPDYSTEEDRQANKKQRWDYPYYRHVKQQKPTATGEAVELCLHWRKT